MPWKPNDPVCELCINHNFDGHYVDCEDEFCEEAKNDYDELPEWIKEL